MHKNHRENDNLSYSIASTSTNENITPIFSGNSVRFISDQNWYGNDWIIFRVSDGNKTNSSNNVTLKVLPMNDAPVLQNIPTAYSLEGGIVQVQPQAQDVDGDNLSFSYTSPLNSSGMWKTSSGDVGIYSSTVSVTDGNGGSDSGVVTIQVISKVLINEVGQNVNSWVEIYNPSSQNVLASIFSLENSAGNKVTLPSSTIPSHGFLVFESSGWGVNESDHIKLAFNSTIVDDVSLGSYDDGNVSDNAPALVSGKSVGRILDGQDSDVDVNDFKVFDAPTRAVSNSFDMVAPIVEIISPIESFFSDIRAMLFSFRVTDDKVENISCTLVTLNQGNWNAVQSVIAQNGSVTNVSVNNFADGNYTWNVRCTDGTNLVYGNENRTFMISAPDSPLFNFLGTQTINENETVQFTISASDLDGDNLSYSATQLPTGAMFNSSTRMFSWTPSFNQSGNYHILFEVKDSQNLTSTLDVPISVRDVELPPTFDDAEFCTEKDSDIKVEIQDPKKNDDFELGETIEGEITIDNNADEDVDFEVKVYLYDLTDNEVLEELDDLELSVDENDDADLDFSLEIPSDVDEDHKIAVYVFAGEDDDEFCNSDYVMVELERPNDKVVIEDFSVTPETTSKGSNVAFNVKVENLGTRDQDDVYVTLENSVLKISQKSDIFSLDQFDDDEDKKTVTFNVLIPGNASGAYEFTAVVHYSDGSDSESVTLQVDNGQETVVNQPSSGTGTPTIITPDTNTGNQVSGSVKEVLPTISITNVESQQSVGVVKSQTSLGNSILLLIILDILLAIGILIFLIKIIMWMFW